MDSCDSVIFACDSVIFAMYFHLYGFIDLHPTEALDELFAEGWLAR